MCLYLPLVATEFATEKNTMTTDNMYVEDAATECIRLLEGGSVAVILFGSDTNISIMKVGNRSRKALVKC